MGGSTGAALGSTFPSPRLSWARLAEILKVVPRHIPVYLKGVQTASDALRAASFGVRGIIVSNHGGRVCGDTCGSLLALEDISHALRSAGLLSAPNCNSDQQEGCLELYLD